MSGGLGDSVKIDIDDAVSLAKGMRGYASEIAYGTVAPSSFGRAANAVRFGFADFRLADVCAAKSSETATANGALSDALEAIGDNTVKCVDAFHHTDYVSKLQIENASTWKSGK
ncbi:hypothetical protein [Nocardia camponoti]|uniref:Uncharacterized protein n=1 Tax=Nocardia camponoti TaxID=1616106 RepID=A0A917QK76_9NOCA|nr:hypothetical protein [Nocardia camponoti]GGK53248.1 hypothetical protein GCM10011591_26300 [Nocardia camponoti]